MSAALARTAAKTALKIVPGLGVDDLAVLEALLREQREVLLKDLAGLEQDSAGAAGSTFSNHIADLGSDSAELDFNLSRSESASGEIREIDEALARLQKGSYGTCEDCGLAVPLERLRALPFARQCIPCKMAEEKA